LAKGQPQGIAPTTGFCRGNPLWLPRFKNQLFSELRKKTCLTKQ